MGGPKYPFGETVKNVSPYHKINNGFSQRCDQQGVHKRPLMIAYEDGSTKGIRTFVANNNITKIQTKGALKYHPEIKIQPSHRRN
jgi:hypothetical protein